MPPTKFPFGKRVTLLVDLQGFPDNRAIQYEIWRKKSGQEEKIVEFYGATNGGKGIGHWTPEPSQIQERKEVLPLERSVSRQFAMETFYFIARLDDKTVKSEDWVFSYPLDIFLTDEAGHSVNGAKCTVTFSDGSKKKEVLGNGHIKIDDAPSGKFKIELAGYEFIFK